MKIAGTLRYLVSKRCGRLVRAVSSLEEIGIERPAGRNRKTEAKITSATLPVAPLVTF